MPLGQLRSLKDCQIWVCLLAPVQTWLVWRISPKFRFKTWHPRALRFLKRDPRAPRASHCHSVLCTQSSLVVSKYQHSVWLSCTFPATSSSRNCWCQFTFMLPCIVIDFFLNNQPHALIIPILFRYKTLHVSSIFSAHYQEFFTVHSALVSFMQVSDDRFQAESGWNWFYYKMYSTECTVENSWWWAEKMPETCRVL